MGDRIEVPLELSIFEVVGSELVEGELQVKVRSTFPRACYHCGSVDVIGHGRCQRRLRTVGMVIRPVLIWEQRRYRCRDCGRTSRERHPQTLGAKRLTARFRRSLALAACSQPWSDIATREAVSWWRIGDAFDAWAADQPRFGSEAPRVISLDESAFKSKFIYHTVLSAPEQRRILELVEGKPSISPASPGRNAPLLARGPRRGDRHVLAVPAGGRRNPASCPDGVRTSSMSFVPATMPPRGSGSERSSPHGGGQRRRSRPATQPPLRSSGVARPVAPWVEPTTSAQASEPAASSRLLSTLKSEWPTLKEAFAQIYQAPDRAEAEDR